MDNPHSMTKTTCSTKAELSMAIYLTFLLSPENTSLLGLCQLCELHEYGLDGTLSTTAFLCPYLRIWIGTIATVVSATIAVLLRFISRSIAKAGLWWDDWVIMVSLIINWGMAITRWIQVLSFSFGKHGAEIPITATVAYQKSFMAIQLIYFMNAGLTKSSLLLLYHRIFGIVSPFRVALGISWFLILGYFVACVIASIAGCLPPAYLWTRFENPNAQGSCFGEIAFFRWNGLANMLLDILMLVLPLPMVWQMRTSRRQKVLLTGIFLMGSFVCVVSLLRIISFDASDRRDPTYTQVPSSTRSSVGQGTGIVCACLPTLRPLRRVGGDRGGQRESWMTSWGSLLDPSSKRSSGQDQDQDRDQDRAGEMSEVRRWADDGLVGVYADEELFREGDDGLGGRGRLGV
ncbi:hypothetical protein BDW62DRAFT_200472 [Aspergillus aurantiobrunneus]